MLASIRHALLCCLVFFTSANVFAQTLLVEKPSPADFPLVGATAAAPIYYSDADAKIVSIAARHLAADIERVTGKRPEVTVDSKLETGNSTTAPAVVVGTLGQSPLIDALVASGKLDVSTLSGTWESFLIVTIENRVSSEATGLTSKIENSAPLLIIAGSDPRGTAFGVYELSQAIGVSPWHWWADVTPAKRATLAIAAGAHQFGPPSVKYRGIHINNEDWGLQPWAAKTFEPENKGIGPKTYEKIFELLLRLKANTLWHATGKDTPPFDSFPANAALAADHAIIIGTPPAEPAPGNPAAEWTPPGDEPTLMFSDDGFGYIRHFPTPAAGSAELPLGANMVMGASSSQTRKLEAPATSIGAAAPTENCKLKTVNSGGDSAAAGIYYHLSRLGKPLSCLWLCTTPPALIWEETTKARALGAGRAWIVNAGDIKPAEIGIEFFLQTAWDIRRWNPGTLPDFLPEWAAREFGPANAAAIARLMEQYYAFNFERRPEHLQWWLPGEKPRPSTLSRADRDRRRAIALSMNEKLAALRDRIPAEKQDAFYQLVDYPVQAAILANNRYFAGEEAALKHLGGDKTALNQLGYLGDVLNGQLARITHRYNALTAGGKWNGIMQLEPADAQHKTMRISAWRVPAFQLPLPPETKEPLAIAEVVRVIPPRAPLTRSDLTGSGGLQSAGRGKASPKTARKNPGAPGDSAAATPDSNKNANATWRAIPGLGRSGNAHALIPASAPALPPERAADASVLVFGYTLAVAPPATATVTARIHILPARPADNSGKYRLAYVFDAAPAVQPPPWSAVAEGATATGDTAFDDSRNSRAPRDHESGVAGLRPLPPHSKEHATSAGNAEFPLGGLGGASRRQPSGNSALPDSATPIPAAADAPQYIERAINHGGPAWEQGVLSNERVIIIAVPPFARAAGAHTLHIHGLSPGMVVDRVTIE